MGLWREGSYGISPGEKNWAFQVGAWAYYKRVDLFTVSVFQLRIKPLDTSRQVKLALGTPDNVVAIFDANKANAPPNAMGLYNVTMSNSPLTYMDTGLFLLPDGSCVIDYFVLL